MNKTMTVVLGNEDAAALQSVRDHGGCNSAETLNLIQRMKLLTIVVLVSLIIQTQAQNSADRFNSVNIDEVLSNKRLLTAYIKCVLDKGRCTPEGKELKSHISDELQNGCESCTDIQKDGARKVIGHLVKHEEDYWKQLLEKYDPEGVYTLKYENELKSI